MGFAKRTIKKIVKKIIDLISFLMGVFSFLIAALLIMENFLFLPRLNKKLGNLLGEKLISKILLFLLLIVGIVFVLLKFFRRI